MKAKLHLTCLVAAAAALASADDSAAAAPESARKSGEVKTITLPGGATMEMVWCAPGKFEMGSPADESGRFDNEMRHTVTITKGFWIGKYEVTQRQWVSVMRTNGSRFKNPDNPVENLSWHDCMVFIKRVNAELKGLARLPTEAEWEYACRAGSDAPVAGNGVLADMAWYDLNSDNQAHEVGKNKPNAWGCTTCTGTCWSGAPTGFPSPPPMPWIPRARRRARSRFFAEDAGSSTRGTAAAPTA